MIYSTLLTSFLKDYLSKEDVECFVVGLAKNLDNTPSESARFIEPFVLRLKEAFPKVRIERVDERFTSKIAFQTMIDAGLKQQKRRDKALVDKISATRILQSFLDTRKQFLIQEMSGKRFFVFN